MNNPNSLDGLPLNRVVNMPIVLIRHSFDNNIVLFDIEPELIVVPGRGEYEFVEDVRDLVSRYKREKPEQPVELMLGLSAEFNLTTFASLFPIEETLKMENQNTISAASALLSTIKKLFERAELPSELEWFEMSQYMAIDYDALIALQVLADESHPNMHILQKRGGICLLRID